LYCIQHKRCYTEISAAFIYQATMLAWFYGEDTMLQVRLLGQFDIRADGKRVEISSRAAQSLLAYLMLTAGIAHRRERLAGLLWPDTSDDNARHNLRTELWRVRKAIGRQLSTDTDYILAEELTVTFNPEADHWLDVTQLERPDLDLQSLISSLSLYQGELLPGFYDDWIGLERERIQSVFEIKMGQLLDQLVAAEHWTAAQEWSERWLALGNTPEPAYRALMLAYGARGDMTRVASVYQHCVDDLHEQLGVEPSAETRALYDGLLKGAKAPLRSAAQPSGTVTFLFTDIEGSTRLLDRLGDQYASVLAEHHQVLRAAVQKWNGREVDTQGDAFFVTFARALDAVQCAIDAQRALAAHEWINNERVRVRMGLHTGEPLIASTGYVGMDVHRAARIGDAGHGGQVLLSHTTRELVARDLPAGVTLRDLGEHRLKDLKYPSPIYQLIIDGLPIDFPPLKTKFTGTEAPTPGEPPFKGLQYFDESDSALFYGREVLTTKLANRLREARFLSVIIGASGSGKSSLVRAGLIPSLKKENADWKVHVITPTAHPLEALATELTRDSESVTATAALIDDLMKDPRSLYLYLSRQTSAPDRTLLVIDQFEELFTLCRDEFEREAFIDNLLTAITPLALEGRGAGGEGGSDRSITLIVTLRADFYAHLAQYPELREAVAQQQEYIGPMNTDELRRAIEEPAKRGYWEFEPGLVDLILRDVGDEPGALPLLSHALLETWKRRAGHTLTLKGYADAGGVRGAIAHTAENVYQNLSSDDQLIARNIFLRLTELGEGTEDTRRRASFDELTSHTDKPEQVQDVLNLLAQARLITLGEDTAEVAHEALIREWPTLREWLNQDREGLRLHRQLTEAAQEWEILERDPGAVYRGARLSQAREWAALHPTALNAQEHAFLDGSNTIEQGEAADREAQIQRELEAAQKLAETQTRAAKQLRRRAIFLASAFVLAIVLAGAALFLGNQANQNAAAAQQNAIAADTNAKTADQQRTIADANAKQAEAEQQIATARELAAAAVSNLSIDPERSILLSLQAVNTSVQNNQPVLLEAQDALHRSLQTSRVLATLRAHTASVIAVVVSPDGKHLATMSDDQTLKVWDTVSNKELLSIPTGLTTINFPRFISFSPAGKRLAAPAGDHLVKVWDVASGKVLLTLSGHTDEVLAIAFSPDGTIIATGSADATTKLWNAATGQEVKTLTGQGNEVATLAFSPDGSRL
jgi:class 3 adenylate cyclase